ncbi:MAG: hypothetical protein ACK55I_29900, partial [bacterium]
MQEHPVTRRGFAHPLRRLFHDSRAAALPAWRLAGSKGKNVRKGVSHGPKGKQVERWNLDWACIVGVLEAASTASLMRMGRFRQGLCCMA